ncbi:MAG TPA: FAD-dependent monooxygenase, partial [Streptosporangiaceae bacterium]|nr:FAD-dependent monooxygenase [Streptosporangiaceae bacterium]
PPGTLIRNDIYDRRPARTWGRGRVALVGDAIHPMTPDLAQGACQAIFDATTLATCLAASRDTRAALREYQQRRWRNAATTTLIARNTGAMGQWKGRITCAARDTVMRVTPLSLQLRQFDVVLRPGRASGQRTALNILIRMMAGPPRIDPVGALIGGYLKSHRQVPVTRGLQR